MFGVLILLEFADTARAIQLETLQRSRRLTDDQRLNSLIEGLKYTLQSVWKIIRIIIIIVVFVSFMWFRLLIHGEHQMYQVRVITVTVTITITIAIIITILTTTTHIHIHKHTNSGQILKIMYIIFLHYMREY